MARAKMVSVKGASPVEQTSDEVPKIMSKPLPQILDELEEYIHLVEEAVRQARAAAGESKEAAAQAKAAGERAAAEAATKAEAAIPRSLVRKILTSWEFILTIVVVLLASLFASIAISVGLSGLH
jgi:hypothetical protein